MKHVMSTATTHAPTLLSQKGMKELKKSIETLEHDYKTLLHSLKELDKTLGHDERLERIEHLSRLELVEAELADKKHILATAKILPTTKAKMKVAIGSVVDLLDHHGQLIRYTLVDTVEANPSDGRISVVSPLGQRLVGKTLADTVEWSGRLGTRSFRLVAIR